MRGKTKLISLSATLSVLLVVYVVFGTGIIDASKLPLILAQPPAELDSPGPNEVFVNPDSLIGDYLNDPEYQVGNTVTAHVNVTDVTDLYTWQFNMTWDPLILNVTRIIPGEFLARSPNQTSTEALGGIVINSTNYAVGTLGASETILGNIAGITGSGRLASVEFEIVGYGWSFLTISLTGELPTTLMDHLGVSVVPEAENGWFDNRITGDSDGNGVVSISDMGDVSDHWTAPPGVKPYERYVDWDGSGTITISDMGIVSDNWGRHYP
jgi:hypothetical protein